MDGARHVKDDVKEGMHKFGEAAEHDLDRWGTDLVPVFPAVCGVLRNTPLTNVHLQMIRSLPPVLLLQISPSLLAVKSNLSEEEQCPFLVVWTRCLPCCCVCTPSLMSHDGTGNRGTWDLSGHLAYNWWLIAFL